jgi:hypothetical protein
LGERFINGSGALRGEGANVCLDVVASAAKQSILSLRGKMDCFAALAMTAGVLDCLAEPVIGRHSRDPLARNDDLEPSCLGCLKIESVNA